MARNGNTKFAWGTERERGGGECNEDSSIHPHHRRLAPHLLICFLKSGGEDYLANHFGWKEQPLAKVDRGEGRRKVNPLVNFSHEIFKVPFHLHLLALGYIDSFSSNLILPSIRFLFCWTITLVGARFLKRWEFFTWIFWMILLILMKEKIRGSVDGF